MEYKTLGEIAKYRKERVPATVLTGKNYIGVENLLQNRQGRTLSSSVPKTGSFIGYRVNDILIGNIRPYLKKIWLADIDGGTNGDVLAICINEGEKIAPKFLYYVLSSDLFFAYDTKHSKGGKMPRGDKNAVLKYPIPIPPLPVQAEIVRILDKFDALTTDLSAGLPAELKARRQQYEYYRDKLLTFPRMTGEPLSPAQE